MLRDHLNQPSPERSCSLMVRNPGFEVATHHINVGKLIPVSLGFLCFNKQCLPPFFVGRNK